VEYQLENYDEGWIRAGRDRRVRYGSLPPGSYRFLVRARSAGSEFGPIAASQRLTIVPHWHERGFVRACAALGLLGSIVTFFRGRTRRLLLQRSLLEAEIGRRREAEAGLLSAQANETNIRRHLARAEEAERSRIARELHDDLSQRLAAASMGLRATTHDLEGTIRAEHDAALKDSLAVIEELSTDVHVLSRQLHPAVLDDLGLLAALRSECQRRRSIMSATVTLTDSGATDAIRGDVGLALFRVAQEALQNASKHANASHVRVSLDADGPAETSTVTLSVEDDGRGFDQDELNGPGLGLLSMRERMTLVGGQLTVTSNAQGGTSVVATARVSPQEAILTPRKPPASAPDRARRTSHPRRSEPVPHPSPPDRSHHGG
ncbi:MAG: ATP-binding protein, partial [Planctomycetota bacterium]